MKNKEVRLYFIDSGAVTSVQLLAGPRRRRGDDHVGVKRNSRIGVPLRSPKPSPGTAKQR